MTPQEREAIRARAMARLAMFDFYPGQPPTAAVPRVPDRGAFIPRAPMPVPRMPLSTMPLPLEDSDDEFEPLEAKPIDMPLPESPQGWSMGRRPLEEMSAPSQAPESLAPGGFNMTEISQSPGPIELPILGEPAEAGMDEAGILGHDPLAQLPISGVLKAVETIQAPQGIQAEARGPEMSPAALIAMLDDRAAMEGQERERSASRYDLLGDVAETLGNLEFPTGAQIRAGTWPRNQPPMKATSLRSMAQRRRDQLTPSERGAYGRSMGTALPPGASKSDLDRFGGSLARLGHLDRSVISEEERRRYSDEFGFELDPKTTRNEALRMRSQKLAEERMMGIDERAGENRTLAERRLGKVPWSGVEKIANYNAALDSLHGLRDVVKRGSTGPIQGLWQQVARHIGLANPQALGDQALLTSTVAQYLFGEGGKQLTGHEMSVLRPALPSRFDTPGALDPMLDAFEKMIQSRKKALVGAAKEAGYKPGGDEEPEAAAHKAEATPKQKVRVRNKQTGQTGTITPPFDETKYERI